MTMTLGEAMTTKDHRDINLKDKRIDKGLDDAKKKLVKEGKAFNRTALNGALKKAIMVSLDVALDEMIGEAWRPLKEVQKYSDPNLKDVNTVTLSDHTIEALHEPEVDVVVSNITVHTFKFSVSVNLNVKGANLQVQGGKIQAIQLADLELSGSVSLHDHTLLEKKLAKVAIPVEMQLANPISILPNTV